MENYEFSGVKEAEKNPWKNVTSGNITLTDASLYYTTVVGFHWNSTGMKDTDTSVTLNAWKNLYPAANYARWYGYSVRQKENFFVYALQMVFDSYRK